MGASSVYYHDSTVTLIHANSLDALAEMPADSVDCIVTSPPYFALRNYGLPPTHWPETSYVPMAGLPPVNIEAMACALGCEPTPQAFIAHLVLIFEHARRVLVSDGTLWLNIGDSYSSRADASVGPISGRSRASVMPARVNTTAAVPRKNLLGIPWQLAFALQAQGWILRKDVIWNKPNATPESVQDRPSSRYEDLFLFSKSPRYWFDLDPIRQPHADVSVRRAQPHRSAPGRSAREGIPYEGIAGAQTMRLDQMNHPKGRNPGDVWTIPTQPFPGAHFAAMPPRLAQQCVLAGCKPGGTVLDPFNGSGTTGLAAQRSGRRYVGVDLKAEYLKLSLTARLRDAALDFQEGA